MKSPSDINSSPNLQVLHRLLFVNNRCISRGKMFIRIPKKVFFKSFLSDELSLEDFINFLNDHEFEVAVLKNTLVILTKFESVYDLLNDALNELEIKQEKLWKTIEGMTSYITQAKSYNMILKKLLEKP